MGVWYGALSVERSGARSEPHRRVPDEHATRSTNFGLRAQEKFNPIWEAY